MEQIEGFLCTKGQEADCHERAGKEKCDHFIHHDSRLKSPSRQDGQERTNILSRLSVSSEAQEAHTSSYYIPCKLTSSLEKKNLRLDDSHIIFTASYSVEIPEPHQLARAAAVDRP
jgi:hypothetical protein